MKQGMQKHTVFILSPLAPEQGYMNIALNLFRNQFNETSHASILYRMMLSQKESASRFQFLKPCFTGNKISTNDTSSFENTPFTCLHQGDGNAENELQRLKLDIVGRKPENCRAVEIEARELQNQHLSQGLKNLEHQPSDKQISISKYPIQGPCIKCTEKS